MKISKSQLRQIIKEELDTLSENYETDQLAVSLLERIVEDINSAYNRVGSSQELFADLLKKNVDLYLQRWEEEREPVVDDEDPLGHLHPDFRDLVAQLKE